MEVFNLMYKDYNIVTIAKLLGIFSKTLRYYESKNVIKPKRDPDTGCRYYNAWELHMLLQAEHYQSYGYTLKEIVKLFQHQELNCTAIIHHLRLPCTRRNRHHPCCKENVLKDERFTISSTLSNSCVHIQ